MIEGHLPEMMPPEEVSGTVAFPRFLKYTPTYSTLAVNLAAPGLLILADLYYPGWQALVDGAPVPLYATNLAFRGVLVPVGNHQVEFVYRPFLFTVGLYLSLAAIILIVILLILDWRIRRQKKAQS